MAPVTALLGTSRAIEEVRGRVQQLLTAARHAHRFPPILIQGETGTGKGLLVRLMHREGPRRSGPFIDISCAAIPDALLEAELFGYERGAFTDARQAKPGLFQAAHQGILFLDEVALLPGNLQAKLLKAIEERSVRRLGGTRAEDVDVMVISATNEDLAAAARDQRFRSDLYHRLAVVTLTLPPLRERPEDILLLAEHFLSRTCVDYGLVSPKRLSDDARSVLQRYGWPGNVRELSNVIESAVLLAETPVITAQMLDIPDEFPAPQSAITGSAFDEQVGDLERQQIVGALNDTNWNVSRAAIILGISRNRLRYRIEKHRLGSDRTLPRSGRSQRQSAEAATRFPAAPTPLVTVAPTDVRWERRHLALLRVDLLVEGSALPGAARTVKVISDKIGSFGGCLEESWATGLVGAFGLDPVENASSNAALAALAIQNAVERARTVDPGISGVTISIHTGEHLVRRANGRVEIGANDRQVTQGVLAALSSSGRAKSIVISAAAAPFLERRFELVAGGAGAGDLGPTYRLVRLERTGFGLGGRALTQFVGRQRELDAVEDQVALMRRHRGQIVAVVGEPGVGKSRFVYEVTRADYARGCRILSCRAFPYGVNTPSLPVVELLKVYLQIEDAHTPAEIRHRVREKILRDDHRLESRVPALLALLDAGGDDPAWRALEPAQRRQQTMDAVKHVLLQASVTQPLLVIFEDLHWIDTATQGLLDSLAESLAATRILLMVTYRPEYRHRWGAKTYYTQLNIGPLREESADALLQHLIGDDASLLPLKRLLIERTDGNPLFIEESVRALTETGTIRADRGTYRLNAAAARIEVPPTIQALLAGRVDRLPLPVRQVLQAASVIGKDVPYVLLAEITGQPEESVRRGLALLQEAELLYETRIVPDLEYTFKHALTHEVTYASLTADRRRSLHSLIVAAIERQHGDRLSEHLERLAQHSLRGALWEKAVHYGRLAGNRALDRSALVEALAHFEQARTALRELPESRQRSEQFIDVCFEQRNALLPLGQFIRLGRELDEARMLAEALHDQRRLGWALGYLSVLHNFLGEHARAIETAENACALAEAIDDSSLRVATNFFLGQALWFAGGPARAVEPLRVVSGLVSSAAQHERFGLITLPAVLANLFLATVYADLGQFDDAIASGEAGLRIARAAGHSYSENYARYGLGYASLYRGNLVQAIEVLEPGLAPCRTMGYPLLLPLLAASLGCAYLWSGRAGEALPLLEEAVDVLTEMRILAFRSFFISLRAEAYLAVGRSKEAQEEAEFAVALARRHEQRGWEAWALKVLGDVLAHVPSDARRATEVYRQSLALSMQIGMRPLVAHCHVGLAELCIKAGDELECGRHLHIATKLYREMGMGVWLEQAERKARSLIDLASDRQS